MRLLKPRGDRSRLLLGANEGIYLLAKGRIRQHAFDAIPRDRLQNNPGVLRKFPQDRIKGAPHFVGSMVPRPTQIQGKLRQGIKPLDCRGQKTVYRMTDTSVLAY